jgi:hypothetical protein
MGCTIKLSNVRVLLLHFSFLNEAIVIFYIFMEYIMQGRDAQYRTFFVFLAKGSISLVEKATLSR